eukprot:jgi/Chrzof1/5977/Cz16g22120.t1
MAVRVEEEKQSSSGLDFKLHPLVLINISDHHTRLRANSQSNSAPTVMGCLLGAQSGRTVDVSNSFEIKYATTEQGVQIDEPFLAKKQEQYKTVFPKLDVVGWYVTGSRIEETHMQLHRKIMELNESAVLLMLNPSVDHTRKDLPVDVYETEFHVVNGVPQFIFVHANYSVETSDAERIGVDQVAKILPSGKATGSEQLNAHLTGLHSAIKMLTAKVGVLQQYMHQISSGEVPFPHAIVRQVSSLVHSLPALDTPAFHKDYLVEYNDTMATLYLASVTKGVSGLNELVDKFMLAYEKIGRRRAGVAPASGSLL